MTLIDSQLSIPKFTQPPNRLLSPNLRSKTTAEMANQKSQGEDISSAQAVFLGALAPGVNGPTWTTLRLAFVMLGVSLAVMLGLAFSSSDSWLVLHVAFLVLITMTLFLLLSWYWALLSNTHYFFSSCNFQFGQFVGGLNSEIQVF